MNIEEKYNDLVNRLNTDIHGIINESMTKIHTDLLPHVESDTTSNVQVKTQQAVNMLLANDFTRTDDQTIKITDYDGLSVRIRITEEQYDRIRKNLIESMPTCPKDLEIQSLKKQLESEYPF